jgi:hypothetical protein
LIGIGLFSAVSGYGYEIGTPTRMEAGFFPFALGVIAILLGATIALTGLRQAEAIEMPEWRPFLTIIAAIAAFGLLTGPLGYLPGVAAAVFIATFANQKLNIPGALVLTAVVSFGIWLIFTLGLRLSTPAIRGFY